MSFSVYLSVYLRDLCGKNLTQEKISKVHRLYGYSTFNTDLRMDV